MGILGDIGGMLSGAGAVAGAFGGGGGDSNYWARQNIKLQKEFAQKGIQWRVADAQAAGIHPLYAIGANTASYQPVQIGDSGRSGAERLGSAMQGMGQSLSRASAAVEMQKERDFKDKANELQLQNLQLQNDAIALQIDGSRKALLSTSQVPPPYPNDGRVIPQPATPITSDVDSGARQAGRATDFQMIQTDNDGKEFTLVPSSDRKNATEDNLLYESQGFIRDFVRGFTGNGLPAPAPGYRWNYNPITGVLRQVKIPRHPKFEYTDY